MEYIWGDTKPYYSYKQFLTTRFGARIQKLTIDAGFTCPNRDGTKGWGGCTYCLNDAFNPSYCIPAKSIAQQLEEGIEFHQNRYRRADGYFAYFQAYSNTYAPLEKLKQIYEPALQHPLVKGVVIGTRPDCIDEEKLDYFAQLNEKRFVSLEIGIESCDNRTLAHINRGHTFEDTVQAIEACAQRGLHTGGHLIFGLPNETPEQWMREIELINALPLSSIKFHQLQIIKKTAMAEEFLQHYDRFHSFTLPAYMDFIIHYVERLRPDLVIERFAGEVPPRFLLINNWGTIRYDAILQKIEQKMKTENSWQGKYYQAEQKVL
jgi:radical SAM protein (TIGR01212 family)